MLSPVAGVEMTLDGVKRIVGPIRDLTRVRPFDLDRLNALYELEGDPRNVTRSGPPGYKPLQLKEGSRRSLLAALREVSDLWNEAGRRIQASSSRFRK